MCPFTDDQYRLLNNNEFPLQFVWGRAMLRGPQISSISAVSRILLLGVVSVRALVTVFSSTGALGSMGSFGTALSGILLSGVALV